MAEEKNDYQCGDKVQPGDIVLVEDARRPLWERCFFQGQMVMTSKDISVIGVIHLDRKAGEWLDHWARPERRGLVVGQPFSDFISQVFEAGRERGQAELAEKILEIEDLIGETKAVIGEFKKKEDADPAEIELGDLTLKLADQLRNLCLEVPSKE